MEKIKVGISACLLGQAVRYNGKHKKSALCADTLSQWFEFEPICPEVEIGMGIPREPIRLVNENNQVRVKNVTNQSKDYTDQLNQLADDYVPKLNNLCGYIFMQKSPSCGVYQVEVHDESGKPRTEYSSGAFAGRLKRHFPLLPMEEADRINDKRLRENFLTRVFSTHDWKLNVMVNPQPKKLVAFHDRYTFLLQVHAPTHLNNLNQLVADARLNTLEETLAQYWQGFVECLVLEARVSNHVKLLHHILGSIESHLSITVKNSISKLIRKYKEQKVDLIVLITILKHYIEYHEISSLISEKYLSPFPYELSLKHNT